MADSSIAAELLDGIGAFFERQGIDPPPGADEPLLEGGILDSFQAIELVQHLENAFSVEFVDDDLTHENFRSVHTVLTLVASKRLAQ